VNYAVQYAPACTRCASRDTLRASANTRQPHSGTENPETLVSASQHLKNPRTVGNNFRQEDLAPAHGHSQLGELLAIARFCTAKDFVRTNRRDGVTRVQGFPGSKTHRADYTTPSAANCAARTTDWTTKVFRIHIENAPTGFPFHRCAWGGLERAAGTIMGVESAK
jgi:hypothetical protein